MKWGISQSSGLQACTRTQAHACVKEPNTELLGSGQSGQMGTRSKAWGSSSLTTDFCGAHAWACCPCICHVRGKWYISEGERPSDWKKLFPSTWCCTWKTLSFPSLSSPQVMKSMVKVEMGPCWLLGWGLGHGTGGEAHSDGAYSGQQSGGWGGSNACLQHFGGHLQQMMEPNSSHYWQTVKRGAAASSCSLVDSTSTLGKTSPGGRCCPGQITQVWGRITTLGELQSLGRKIYSVGNSPAGTGGWTRPWRWLPASVFVIFFNILSSFYWNGNYFILTSYKSRLFLNIGWMYLLENSYLVCVAVESQVAIIHT